MCFCVKVWVCVESVKSCVVVFFFPAASGHWACVAEILSLGGLLLTPTLMMETLWMYVLKCCVFLCVHVSVCVCTCAWCVCVNRCLIAPWTRNCQPVPSPNEPWSSGDGVWMTLNDGHMCVCLYVCVRVCVFESVVCVVQMVSYLLSGFVMNITYCFVSYFQTTWRGAEFWFILPTPCSSTAHDGPHSSLSCVLK